MRYFTITFIMSLLICATSSFAKQAAWKCMGPAFVCGESHNSRVQRFDPVGDIGRAVSDIGGRIVLASYYASGHTTASGERFRPSGMTAASRTLPFGTRVRVTNVRNGRSVIVRINDRGPAKWTGKAIDLSRGAFRRIASTRQGVAKVRIAVID